MRPILILAACLALVSIAGGASALPVPVGPLVIECTASEMEIRGGVPPTLTGEPPTCTVTPPALPPLPV